MHLQEPVDELVKQVQMNEGKIAIYEQRTSVTIAAGGVSRPPAEEAGRCGTSVSSFFQWPLIFMT